MAKKPTKKTTTPIDADRSYLERLTFIPEMANTWVAKYIANIRVVLLLIITILLLGTVAYLNLPKRLNPEVKIPIVSVATVLPGASSKDVEQLATIPIEDSLRGLAGLDVISSSSQENISVITLQFVSTVNRDDAKDEVQSAVDTVQLPENAQKPLVREFDFEDQPIWTFALTRSGSYPDLMYSAQALEDHIKDLSRVDRVNTTGFDEQEIAIEVQPEKLEQYAITPFQLSQAIQKARANYPAGSVVTGNNTFAISVDPEIETVKDIRNLQLNIDGRVLSLAEVATVQQRSVPNQPITLFAQPNGDTQPAVVFYVYKTLNSNIDQAGAQVEEAIDAFLEERPELNVTTIINTSEEIADQFDELLGEFRSTIILVFITLLLFLGLRQALISSLTVPLTFLSAFFLMQFAGMSINFLTMFAFLLALGLLVDDTIVVVSAMTQYFKVGKFTPLQTGVLVWKDTIVPIWSTTITTIWAFVPLLLATGIIGEFIKPIPIVVTLTMISSTGIAVLITLPLMIVLLKPHLPARITLLFKVMLYLVALGVVVGSTVGNPFFPIIMLLYLIGSAMTWYLLPRISSSVKAGWSRVLATKPGRVISTGFSRISDKGIINVEGIAEKYRRLTLRTLANTTSRRLVLLGVVIYAIFSFALLPLGLVKGEFFPKEGTDSFNIRLELPTGARLEQTLEQVQPVMSKIMELPDVEFVTAEVGRSGTSNSISSALGNAQNSAFFSIRLVPEKDRSFDSLQLAEQARQMFKGYQGGKVSVVESEGGGPPAGADLQIKLLGTNLDQLEEYANQVVSYLESQPGVVNVEKSVAESTSKVRFVPDQAKLAQHNVGLDTIGFALRSYASGFPLDQINFDETTSDKTSIVFRMQSTSSTLGGLGQVTVSNAQFQTIPLSALGTFRVETNPTAIAREDFRRSISVSAGVVNSEQIQTKNTELEAFADTLGLPAGYEWQTGGVNEENEKSVQSIMQAMALSAILILITMVVQFQSFRKAIIVLIVIPLAVSSVFLAFALTGTPLSFPALIGVLSLFGIVVTNSMFIVDKINLNLREKMSFNDALADAGASRLEPIILTKLSTVLGLLPITLSQPLWRGLGGAIISGLLVASTIMLLFIPALYFEMMCDERKAQEKL